MNHEEQKLQMQCVAWFRAQYPQYAMLLTHPINEGSGHTRTDRMRQGIHKAEGTQAGVPDLLFFMPSSYLDCVKGGTQYFVPLYGLGIEFKTLKGRQSQEQKDFQKMFEAARYRYLVVRSLEEFRTVMKEYIDSAPLYIKDNVAEAHTEITKATENREKEKFYKIIGKK